MDRTYWLQQITGKPLFPHLEWSRPEHRSAAGKLLVVGGHLQAFAAPAEAFTAAEKAGIGTVRVLLPDSIRKIVGQVLENGEFAASTPSGSFSQKALPDILDYAAWSDGVLFAGDLGRNSETAILLEKFLAKSPTPVTLTKDAIEYVVSAPNTVLQRTDTLLVLSFSQLQRLAIAARSPRAITFGMDLLHLVEWLHDFTAAYQLSIVVKHHTTIVAAIGGQVSSTRLQTDLPIWRVQTAATLATWWLQNPKKPLQALTAGLYTLSQA